MIKVAVEDVNHRKSTRRTKFSRANVTNNAFPRLYTENGVFCQNNTIDAIQHWDRIAEDTNAAYDKALDAFCELCLNANQSVISTQCSFLVENVDKVRDANSLMNSIKYRNSRLKTKIATKINNKISGVNDTIQNSISNLSQTLHKAGTGSTAGVAKSTQVSESFIDECFDKIYTKARQAKECDRILENYSKIARSFNVNEIVRCISNKNDIYQAVVDITECVDQFNIGFKSKYNAALETSLYALNTNHIYCDKSKIIEAVTDYFIFNYGLTESQIGDIRKLSTSSVLYESSDFDDSDYLWQTSVTDDNTSMDYIEPDEYSDGLAMVSESLKKTLNDKKNELKHEYKDAKKDVRAVNKMVKKNARHGNPEEQRDEEIKAMVDDFRKQCTKNKDDKDRKSAVVQLKALITKIFTRSPAQIIYELPSIFGIIRGSFIVTIFSVNPILGIITLITDQCIKMTLTRKQMEKVIKAYENEISSCNNRLDKVKDSDEKDRLTKYRDKLKEDLEKLREYDRSNYTEEENDERNAYDYDDDFDGDDDFDFDDDDEWGDLDFDEGAIRTMAAIVVTEQLMTSISETLIDDDIDGIVCDNIFKLPNEDLDTAADFAITVPVLHERDRLCEAMIQQKDLIYTHENMTVEDRKRIDCLNENIYKIRNAGGTTAPTTLKESICYLKAIQEILNIEGQEEYVTEMDFSNTLKLAVDNMKRSAVKLSDKEKKISSDIDVTVNQFSKSLQTAMMNGNREAVIKGKVIPSASKCIKLALVTGAAWAINPAIAVIGALGTFACMKKMQKKERQLVIDDIEIELKMCERYIQQAENENDLKKVRELEKTQRTLERQLQRIRYKMNVEYGESTPSSTYRPGGDRD
jgi:hypothetical protein